jgi:hypothetical protein
MCGTHPLSGAFSTERGAHEIAAEKDNELGWRIQRVADVRFIRRNRSTAAGTVTASYTAAPKADIPR